MGALHPGLTCHGACQPQPRLSGLGRVSLELGSGLCFEMEATHEQFSIPKSLETSATLLTTQEQELAALCGADCTCVCQVGAIDYIIGRSSKDGYYANQYGQSKWTGTEHV